MLRYNKPKGQTGIESIIITGAIISFLVVLGAFYFGDVSDQTTAIIILKTELLEQFGGLGKNYMISSSLEPTIINKGMPSEALCFEVRTRPALSGADKAALTTASAAIKNKIAEKTRYKNVEIKLEEACD